MSQDLANPAYLRLTITMSNHPGYPGLMVSLAKVDLVSATEVTILAMSVKPSLASHCLWDNKTERSL